MKREQYGEIKLDGWIIKGNSISSSIKRMLVKESYINKIILNKSSYIDAIETIHALKGEGIITTYIIDNDLEDENVLFFCNNELVGECY